jgi:hypothetical protein
MGRLAGLKWASRRMLRSAPFIGLLESVRRLEASGNDQRPIRAMLDFILTNGHLVEGVDTKDLAAELRKMSLH